MAKNSIRDYSATNSSNTDIQSIDISEGCSPAGINNAIREIMADLKDVSTGAVALESPAMDSLTVDTTGIVYSGGNVGIGTTSPNRQLHVKSSNATVMQVESTNASIAQMTFVSDGAASNPAIGAVDDTAFNIQTGNTERLRIDSSGNAFMKTANSYIAGTTSLGFYGDAASSNGMFIDSSGNVGIGTSSPSGFSGYTSVDINNATNGAIIDLSQGNSMKGRLIATASTMAIETASSVPIIFQPAGTEAMRINSDGRVTISNSNVTNPNVVSSSSETFTMSGALGIVNQSNTPMGINRDGNDGDLIAFRQATVKEGGISVSGTTVSYNGGHLSRWSQLADNTKDETIVKGTVLTNLDQMAVWHHEAVAATYYVEGDELPEITPATYYTEDDTLPEGVSVGDEKTAAVYAQIGDEKTPAVDAYTEDNEQLNCMAVSSVEGDPNVAGVFVNWDNDDDEFNDMNIAMTGDMVIRIAQGTTVARGDLLMSAGDGTAKPQGDDIVRSKTIAKVISTNVSHTYDDGSYLVPCVLMAC